VTILERAKAADARARDMIAISLDRHLASAPMMKGFGAKLLTRQASSDGGVTVATLGREIGWHPEALRMAIARTGAASIGELRRRMTLVRLASVFSDEAVGWELAAEVIGAVDHRSFTAIVKRCGHLPHIWRAGVRLSGEFNAFEAFLHENAQKWALVQVRRIECPNCRHVILAEAA
jgi:hypothetical protein